MNLQDYKIKNSKQCDCGYEFTVHDLTQLKRLDKAIYGGNVRHISETKCPNCSKETLLLLKQVSQSYEVVDIAQKNKVAPKVEIVEDTKATEASKIDSDEDTNSNNEFICSNCKRVFKSKQGLAAHSRTCKN